MNIAALTARMHAIRDHNDWRRYQSPKNLAMAASVEMAELVEIFQWLSEEQSRQLPPEQLVHAGQEVAEGQPEASQDHPDDVEYGAH